MKHKILLSLLFLLAGTFIAEAEKYQIKRLNTPTINIDGKDLKIGDWFEEDAVINWSADNQAMRVLSENNNVFTLTAKRYREANMQNFKDYVLYSKPLATRAAARFSIVDELKERMETRLVLFDEVDIDVNDLDLPKDMSFIVESTEGSLPNGSVTIHPENGNLIIKRDDVITSSINEPVIIELKVGYITDNDELKNITENMELVVLPQKIKE